jgi:dTDP-4-amino-4,6-dideoxygalactose transaminase
LHATKLLNTGEGGGCITKDDALGKKLERIRFFGHDEQKNIVEDGFNGKMTEVHAALGLANLKYYDEVLADRKTKYLQYVELLKDCPGIQFQQPQEHGETNYSYFPVIFESEETVLKVLEVLEEEQLYPRRYFYPSVNTFTKIMPYQPSPVAEDIAKRILCLPLYWNLRNVDIQRIVQIILVYQTSLK